MKLEIQFLTFFIFFIVLDCVYFFWLITLRFSFPPHISSVFKNAILGMVGELKTMSWTYLQSKLKLFFGRNEQGNEGQGTGVN